MTDDELTDGRSCRLASDTSRCDKVVIYCYCVFFFSFSSSCGVPLVQSKSASEWMKRVSLHGASNSSSSFFFYFGKRWTTTNPFISCSLWRRRRMRIRRGYDTMLQVFFLFLFFRSLHSFTTRTARSFLIFAAVVEWYNDHETLDALHHRVLLLFSLSSFEWKYCVERFLVQTTRLTMRRLNLATFVTMAMVYIVSVVSMRWLFARRLITRLLLCSRGPLLLRTSSFQ